jgi:hypothetical protein
MKKIYVISAFALFSAASFAQRSQPLMDFKTMPMAGEKGAAPTEASLRSGTQDTIYYENFSNGLSGSGGGAWQAVDNASFCNWQHTTQKPQGQYSTNIPAINSPSRANGFMILDGDFCNPGNPPSQEILDAYLVSPSINLSNHLFAEVVFYHSFRFCCAGNAAFTMQISIDGGNEWTSIDVRDGIAVNVSSADPLRKSVNISAIAGGQSDVRIRFHKTGASHYYWMIDDVSILEPLENDIAINRAFAGDIFEDWDYYSIPVNQVSQAGMTYLAIVENKGKNSQSGNINFELLLGTQVVHQGTFNFSIAPGVADTIAFNSSFVPDADQKGTYTLRVIAPDDDNVANNIATAPFEITENIMGHIHPGTTTSYGFTDDGEFGLGNVYVLNTTQTAFGARVRFAGVSGTIPGTTPNMEVEVSVFEIDQHQQYGNLWQVIDILSVQSFIVQQSFIGAATPTLVKFPSPVSLEAGKMYMLYVHKYAGADRLRIATSARGAEDWSTVLFAPANTGDMYYFKRSDFAPAINLDFDISIDVPSISKASARLHQNQPNPFNNKSVIRYDLEEAANVTLEVYSVTGQRVMSFNEGQKATGSHSITIDGASLPAGLYYYSLTAGDVKATKKMIVLE